MGTSFLGTNLAHIAAQNQRPLLRRALDSFGAEVMVPLYARGEIIGWLFFGHRITGYHLITAISKA
jgi:hypothetical protein